MAFIKKKHSIDFQNDRLILNLHNFIEKEKIHEAELSRRTGIPQPTLHKILTGKTSDPRISTLQILASYFGVTLDALYGNVGLQKNIAIQSSKSIPIISWTDAIKHRDAIKNISLNHWDQWVVISDHSGENMFALKSKASMEPRFPRGTIFIIDVKLTPTDGDLVVVHYPETKECTVRELSIDGRTELLLPLNTHSKLDRLTKSIKLVGVITQSRFSYQDV